MVACVSRCDGQHYVARCYKRSVAVSVRVSKLLQEPTWRFVLERSSVQNTMTLWNSGMHRDVRNTSKGFQI